MNNQETIWADRRFYSPADRDQDGYEIGPRFYQDLPTSGCRVACGLRLAYSCNPKADKSVLAEGWLHDRNIYILDVKSTRGNLDKSAGMICEKQKGRPVTKIRWYASTTERGLGALLQGGPFGIKGLKCLPANGSRVTRSAGTSLAWNSGNILLPDPELIEAPWLEGFIDGVLEEREELDALVALHDELVPRPGLLAALGSAHVPRRGWIGRVVHTVSRWLGIGQSHG